MTMPLAGTVVYARTTVFPDGSQQVEQFVLSPREAALVNVLLGEPAVINLLSAEQTQDIRDAAGSYASITSGEY